jgi:cellulose biosynthesis protein BcsQ
MALQVETCGRGPAMSARSAVLGLVSSAASWPRRLDSWATSGALPITVMFCPSVEHLQARLRSGQRPAVLLDGDLPMVDRDLLGVVTGAGAAAVVVEGTRRRREWGELGATAVLPPSFDERQLLAAIEPRSQSSSAHLPAPAAPPHAPLVAVTGPGGTGASVAAIALAQGLAAGWPRPLLMDCCLHAEQAMLHNAHGAHPGLADMVELHSSGQPGIRQIRQLTIGVVERGYHLLVGLRRARHWSSLRPASLQVALQSLLGAFGVVVADVDPDVDGEAQTGSAEIEERNALARMIVARSDLVLVVGQPSMKGVYALVRTLIDLLEFGVAPQRLLPVINQASGAATSRSELSRAVRQLISDAAGGSAVSPALFLPDVPLEAELRDRDALPVALPRALATAVDALLFRQGAPTPRRAVAEPEQVTPGALGHWAGDHA